MARDGVYLDELGFGWQYPCYNKRTYIQCQVSRSRRKLVCSARFVGRLWLPPGSTRKRWGPMFEPVPGRRLQLRHLPVPPRRQPGVVNLFRFAIPDYKLFEIIHVDKPLGNDLEAVKHVFFNGEGIWLEGPLSIPKWFPAAIRPLIAKTHTGFYGSIGTPFVVQSQFLSCQLCTKVCSLTSSDARIAWCGHSTMPEHCQPEAKSLKVRHRTRAEYHDAWNGLRLNPRILGDNAFLTFEVGPSDAGCVVQEMNYGVVNTPGQIRTADLRFRKPMLYPLSYRRDKQLVLRAYSAFSWPLDLSRLTPVLTPCALAAINLTPAR